MTDDPTLRRYRPADEARVWELHLAALRESGVDVDAAPPEADADLRSIPSVYLDEDGDFLVCERADRIVATGAYRPLGPDDLTAAAVEGGVEDVAVLKRMRVDPECQRSGHGSLVLDELEQRMMAAGYGTVVLDTSPVQTAAQSFYAAHGYEQVGETTVVHDGERFPLLLYRKRL